MDPTGVKQHKAPYITGIRWNCTQISSSIQSGIHPNRERSRTRDHLRRLPKKARTLRENDDRAGTSLTNFAQIWGDTRL